VQRLQLPLQASNLTCCNLLLFCQLSLQASNPLCRNPLLRCQLFLQACYLLLLRRELLFSECPLLSQLLCQAAQGCGLARRILSSTVL
jgi:hypothetical protein